jgi:hypothetical protein
MKRIIFLALTSVALLACNQPKSNSAVIAEQQEEIQDSYTHNFKEYGFTLKAPCKMEDVSSQAKGDFLVNYGGVSNPNNPNTMVAYQLIVSRLPVGYRDLPKSELDSKVDYIIKSKMSGMKNLESISFGYEGYRGYVGETTHNGLKQKGIIFLKDNYLIALTVLTNNDIESKFDSFTNSFKSISTKNHNMIEAATEVNDKKQSLSFGYSISAPCTLKQYSSSDVNYSYSGAINQDNQEIAIVYKVQASDLPMKYSQMGEFDKKQIKNNLLNYLRSKASYSECKVGIKNHFAYNMTYTESGVKIKGCLMLTDSHVIELMIFSKKGVSDAQLMKFANSLKKN